MATTPDLNKQGQFDPNALGVTTQPREFPTVSPFQFPDQNVMGMAMNQIRYKLSQNQDLVDKKNLVLKQMYNQPLTPDELKKLSPSQVQALQSGDRNIMDMELRLINDQLTNRTNTLDTSINYITTQYTQAKADAQQKFNDAQKTVLQFVQTYGSNAKQALTSLYGAGKLAELSAMGINIDTMTSLPTLAQSEAGTWSATSDANGNQVLLNNKTGEVRPMGSTNVSSGVVGGYDISTYATDPNHESNVAGILSKIGTFSSSQSIDQYIKQVAPNSPITGSMVQNTATKYGVSPEMVVSMMQADSSIGTQGKAISTLNPGNVGNTDSGAIQKFPSWQAGVDAVGSWLSKHKASVTTADYPQYGLLSQTDFNPSNKVDSAAKQYLDYYIKNAAYPTYYALFGRSSSKGGPTLAQVAQRAQDLYFSSTGTSLPDVTILKGNKTLINANNKLLNQLKIQEGTVAANFKLSVQNLEKNKLNQNSQPINAFLDQVKNLMGDPDVAQYLAQNSTVANEIASLVSIKNATGTTVADKLFSAGLVPKNSSEKQQKSILNILLQEAQNGMSAISQTNSSLYQQVDPLETDQQNPNRQTTMAKEVKSTSDSLFQDELSGVAPHVVTTRNPQGGEWSREQVIDQLHQTFPSIDIESIKSEVYKKYPDKYQ